MTTPLLLTAGCFAVATGAVAMAKHRSAPMALSTALAPRPKAAPVQAKTLNESKLKFAKPDSPPSKIVMLEGSFTLVYRLRVTDLRTKAMRDAYLTMRLKEILDRKEVDKDIKTQAQVDEEIADMRAHNTTFARGATVTLAFDGRTLLCEDNPEEADVSPRVNLFDGTRTTSFWMGVPGPAISVHGVRSNGTVTRLTRDLPCIGPSLPFIPVVRGPEVFMFPYADYMPHTSVLPGPKGTVGGIRGGTLDPQGTTALSGWTPLQRTVVAGSIVATTHAHWNFTPPADRGRPELRYEYTLVSARSSVDPTALQPETYMKQDMVFDLEGGRHFTLRHDGGTLDAQIQAFLAGDAR